LNPKNIALAIEAAKAKAQETLFVPNITIKHFQKSKGDEVMTSN